MRIILFMSSTLETMTERRVILFSGRVQGVGFRMTAVHLAADLPLTGTVRNVDDGAWDGGGYGGGVELIVEGAAGDIDRLVVRLSEQFGVSYVMCPSVLFRPPAFPAGASALFTDRESCRLPPIRSY